MKVFESTTFQFCFMVLVVAGLAAGFSGDVTWADWLNNAVYLIGIYAGKEGVRHGATAYKERQS